MPLNNKVKRINPNVIINKLNKQKIINKTRVTKNTNSTNNTINQSVIPKIWNNASVYLIGGGPSLSNFNWDLLKNKHIIAINKAYKVLPEAEVLYWTDSRFYRWFKSDIDALNMLKITCRKSVNMKNDIILTTSTGRSGLEERNQYIKAGSNSGFAAINVAFHLGAKRIYLLGYDMNSTINNTHWHEGYNIRHNVNIYKKSMINNFDGIHELLKTHGVELWNANPDSLLTTIPKCTLESAINDNPISCG